MPEQLVSRAAASAGKPGSGADSRELFESVERYRAALSEMLTRGADQARLFRTLSARDTIAHLYLPTGNASLEEFQAVVKLDQELCDSAGKLVDQAGFQVLEDWQATRQPHKNYWWWYLDEVARENESHLWSLSATFCISVAVSLVTVVASRFFESGPDLLGMFATVMQVFLAAVAGFSLTGPGKTKIRSMLRRLGVGPMREKVARLLLALLALAMAVGVRMELPYFARLYNNHGVLLQRAGRISSAIDNYQRAISLNPDYFEAQYNLGVAYEDISDYEKAITAYLTALRGDSRFYFAANNLARLEMIHNKNFEEAIQLLDGALAINPKEPEVTYSLRKNRGWANLELQNYKQAENDLKAAMEMQPARAAAHCLLALTYAAESKVKDEMAQWEDCLRWYAPDQKDVEGSWLQRAKERLAEQQ